MAGVAWGNSIFQGDGTYSILSNLETFVAQSASNFVSNMIWGGR